jgi:hypothetical protein
MSSTTGRLLIADEIGLGKTVEALNQLLQAPLRRPTPQHAHELGKRK